MISPASESPWLAPSSPEVVWFSGNDVLRFLNDLISQEIGDMDDGESRRSFLLTPQGKIDFILWIIRDGDRYGLVTEPGRGEALAAALGRYRIRVDVDISLEDREIWLVMGRGAGFDVSWPGVSRRLQLGERPDLPEGSVEEYEALRIQAGEPAWDVDIDEGTIPQESGLVAVSVDFEKGCFLGQELVARIDSRGGNVPRRLLSVEAGNANLAVGARLRKGDKEVGRITSCSGSMGLAMVRREVADGDRVMVDGVAASVWDPHGQSGRPEIG